MSGGTAGRDAAPPATVRYETWFGGGSVVTFGHDLHADMLALSCSECHHSENCRSCHKDRAVTAVSTNSRIALHGVCFRCHEQGATLDECDVCHQPAEAGRELGDRGFSGVGESVALARETRAERLDRLARTEARGELDVVGEDVPFERETPPPPEEQIFLASQAEGVSLVRFPHEAHAATYGIACASCHHMQRCSRCHRSTNAPLEVTSLRDALMDNCIECHEEQDLPTACEACHEDPHEM
jgi:primosomal protein N'